MKKFFLAISLAFLALTSHASLFVTLRDTANTSIPECGSNPHFTLVSGYLRVIYFDVRVTNTGKKTEVISCISADLRCVDNTVGIDPNFVLERYARPMGKVTLRPGETKVFTKYSVQQCLNAWAYPDGFYCITVKVNNTAYSDIVRFDNQDLYFITDTNTY